MSKHICGDAVFVEDWIECECDLGRDHFDTECDGSGHS